MALRVERGPAALSAMRTVALGVGFACAVAASITIFVTENPEYLRIGILVALWGFVFAALAAGRRQTEQVMAAGTEVELRKSYELELEREVAARREYELRLEAQLRREVQEDFTSQVGALHEEMVRLRRELSEQWDSELRVERMVMRTQSVRLPGERRDSIESVAAGRATIESDAVESTLKSEPWAPAPAMVEQPPSGPAQDSRRASPSTPYVDGPSTMEFPVSAVPPKPVPTPPVPPRARPVSELSRPPAGWPDANASLAPTAWPDSSALFPPAPWQDAGTPSLPSSPASAPLPEPDPEPADVLSRVLAESGVSAGGRRRKHRYADEDQ